MERVGVLNVQGAVREHADHLRRVGSEVVLVKHPEDLQAIDGLVIPGGESTTIGKLIRKYGLYDGIRERIEGGMPVFGTCAGLILLAKKIEGSDTTHLGVMDTVVDRNSFGRQRESFEADLPISEIDGDAFPCVFIRAPHIVSTGADVSVLATYGEKIVAARQGNRLVTAFHPELSDDLRMHAYFLDMVRKTSQPV
ncbi:pyridoxal 5'-phosphate synthase glutaminase subunit PdxT [Ferroacidibacillus organovorans]|uniref:Pyridoxal 5'-phosphate synthase subunit PdxT n=1 Tax=Ferroacidibacillus organovorans TaxID=1765683 RepID=A0A101XRH1_9BACL|nr:pyridoxal 5'-phosphate synthase glutaminase subunit PdxT [Ferroacidibacillus organovorans]KUO96177.1 glutamine amidotransferase [Ferroacidibacillus organovorans]